MAVFRYLHRFWAWQLCCAIASLAIGTAHAQTLETMPDPIADIPRSVENYSLPPGQNDSSQPPAAEGPVDERNPIAEPVEPGIPQNPLPLPAETERQTEPSAPVVESAPVRQSPPEINDAGPALPAGRRPETPPPPAVPEPEAAPEPLINDRPPARLATPSTEAEPQIQTAARANDAGSSWVTLLIAGPLVLMIALIGGVLARRSRRAQPVEPEDVRPITKTENIQKPTNIPLPAPHPQPAISTAEPEIEIIFLPQQASSTLLNAVLCYELQLRNLSREDLTGIQLSGNLTQASDENARRGSDETFPILQQMNMLKAGESIAVTDEFRIPLATIVPISVKAHRLFVPLARFTIRFSDDSGFIHFQTASFLVGQEHEPPRSKMAAFRLDLGPRTFQSIGCRPLQL